MNEIEISTLSFDDIIRETVTKVWKLIELFRLNLIYYKIVTGKGLEFDRLREYTEGDDASLIDWNSLARTTKPYVKIFKEERMLDVIILLDSSNTMVLGSTSYTKNEYSSILSGIIAYSALSAGDKLGLIMFSDKIKAFLEPSLSFDNFFLMARMLSLKENYGGKKDWKVLFKPVLSSFGPDTYIFFISDFIGANDSLYDLVLKMVNKFKGVFCLMVRDPLDSYLPKGIGHIYLSDPNTGEILLVEADKIREKYNAEAQKEEKQIEYNLKSVGAEFMKLHTNKDFVDEFVKYFRRKGIEWS